MFFEPYRGFMLKIKRNTERNFCQKIFLSSVANKKIENMEDWKTGRLWIKNELTRVIWMITFGLHFGK